MKYRIGKALKIKAAIFRVQKLGVSRYRLPLRLSKEFFRPLLKPAALAWFNKIIVGTAAAVFVAFVFSLLLGVTALGLWNWFHPTYYYISEIKELVSC